MMRLVITDAATEDVNDTWEYISRDSIESADKVVQTIYDEILRIGSTPGIGHRRTDLLPASDIFFWPAGRYLILYRVEGQDVVIVAVFHGSRDIPAALRERDPDE
ncbi:MAG TPA: type II toxin-antitoxin system RelE/ParE family toxin [Acidobacteriaceae bacterium]|nr:type II toxin-antitoxin system RelE/ParE family toxin [Acidobacteriaceae bacterium]